MCVVSMISDHYMERWPLPAPLPSAPFQPLKRPIEITREEWEEYQELKRKAEEYDRNTNQPDCVKPEVESWEEGMIGLLQKRGIIT